MSSVIGTIATTIKSAARASVEEKPICLKPDAPMILPAKNSAG
jgi:hypothetical protein